MASNDAGKNAHQATKEPLEFIIHVFNSADVIIMHLSNWIVLRDNKRQPRNKSNKNK